MRQLFEISVFENLVERLNEIGIGAIGQRAVGRGECRDLGTEIVVVVAQTVERLGIFVVTDRSQRSREAPEQFALIGVCKTALRDHGGQEIFLANRDESVASLVRGLL